MQKVRLEGVIKIDCPVCHTRLDAFATDTVKEVHQPIQGDLSICVYCSAILQFRLCEGGLFLHELTADEFVELPATHRAALKRAQAIATQAREETNERNSPT